MSIKLVKPTTSGRRFASFLNKKELSKARPVKKLTRIKKNKAGRNFSGRVTVRHHGGGHKQLLRKIDFVRRNKPNIPARVVSLEYDPNRGASIALLVYNDGEKRYVLAPDGLKIGDQLITGEKVDFKVGNALPLAEIPVGLPIHNVEIRPGKGGQIARGAGNAATILSKEGKWAVLKLPSGERKKFSLSCFATIGQVSNPEVKLISLGKAGRKRHMGWRPAVRGVAMNPNAHPHGGGEGRSGIGMPSPKSPWGKKTLGKKTRKRRKYSDKLIIKRRK
ncbi:MAG TPA: 50S ribosomal protein L2 [Candidatus Bathyarchaeia archaeon]|nr:50S ribosomal protein L2 [Candidatus Bathyarchaeia archaeon]